MSIFPDDDRAEIAVKQIMIDALKAKKKELTPLMDSLTVEILQLEEDIKRTEEKIEEKT